MLGKNQVERQRCGAACLQKQAAKTIRLAKMQRQATAWLHGAHEGRCLATKPHKGHKNNDCELAEAGRWKIGDHLTRKNVTDSWVSGTIACLARCALCPRCNFVTLSIMDRACMWSRECAEQVPQRGYRWGFVRNHTQPFNHKEECKRDFVMRPRPEFLQQQLAPGESDEILQRSHERISYRVANSDGLIKLLGTGRSTHGQALQNDGLCAKVGEQRAFEERCRGSISTMNASLSRLRFRSGLVFVTPPRQKSVWGLGHVLSIVYAMHFVCRRLRRYCYMSFYDMEIHKLFGYANGELWSPTPEELDRYGQSKHMWLQWDPMAIFTQLRNETSPLVRVTLMGQIPVDSSSWLPHSMPLRFDRRVGQLRLDRCFCRYVTHPLFPPSETDARAAATAAVSYHMRTGFADLTDEYLQETEAAPSWKSIGQWFNLACNYTIFSERTSFVFSDSPGLLAYLHRTLPDMVRRNQKVAGMTGPTRSWDATFADKIPSATDAVLAGMAPEIEYSYLSTFARPAMARSMCTWRATDIERRSCPRYSAVYVRDLYAQIGHSDHLRTMCLRWQMDSFHPCKNMVSRACQRSYVEATAAPTRQL